VIVKDESLLREMHKEMGACEYCGNQPATDLHHIAARGAGGGHRIDLRWNLIGLDRCCHDQAQRGLIPKAVLWGLACQREIWRMAGLSKRE
jgi:hypothetical protein